MLKPTTMSNNQLDNPVVVIILAVVMAVLSLMILLGKGDWMISQYRRLSPEERARYNIHRLRVVCGILILLLAIALPILVLLDANEYIMGSVLITPTAIAVALSYTWCKK